MSVLTSTPRSPLTMWQSIRNIRAMNRDPITFLQHLAADQPNEPLIPFARIHGTLAVIARDAHVAHGILTSRSFELAGLLMNVLAKQFGKGGPFTTEGPEWERQRTLLAPLFKKDETLRGPKAELLHSEVLNLVHALEQASAYGTPVDILELAQNTAIAVACKIVIGARLTARETVECRTDLESMVASTFEAMNNPLLLLSPWYRARTRRAMKRLHGLVNSMMTKDVPDTGFMTALSILKKARSTEHINDELFFSCLIQLITASHETSASAIAWLCRHLAEHQDIMKMPDVRSEALTLSSAIPSADLSFRDFPRLGQIVTEVLMRYPPIISVFRSATVDTEIMLPNHGFIPVTKGTLVYIPLLLLNQDQLAKNRHAPRTPFATSVFSKGPRTCPGGALATRTLMVFLASVINRGLTFTVLNDKGYTAHLAYKPRGLTLSVARS